MEFLPKFGPVLDSPIVLFDAPLAMSTPLLPLPSTAVPAASVPMEFPCTTLPVAPKPKISPASWKS